MSLHRTQLWLALWALAVLVVAPAQGQGLQDAQIFAPAENDQFGGGARANEGFFFQLEGLCWWIKAPHTEAIGSPGFEQTAYLTPSRTVEQVNTLDTSGIAADAVSGTRFETGYIHGHDGFLWSYFNLTGQNERLGYGNSYISFDDRANMLTGYVAEYDGSVYTPSQTPLLLPVKFDDVLVTSRVKTWGTELNYVYRGHAGPHAGIFELLLGARYFELQDRFTVNGYGDPFLREATTDGGGGTTDGTTTLGTPLGPGSILADSVWWATAQNRVIGPQIGLHWFRKNERWTWEAEGRFFAGLNVQGLKQGASLGSQLNEQNFSPPAEDGGNGMILFQPLNMTRTTAFHSASANEWSPGVELRLGLTYQLTRAFDVRVGWSGFWIDGIARSADLIDYSLNDTQIMGIDMKDNRQSVFMHGLTFGFDINR